MAANPFHLSPDISLPLDAVTQTFGFMGKRGSGKTNTAVDLCEDMLQHGQQVIVIDPVGVWWGLRSAANGTQPGYPILVMGGDHGDLPLHAETDDKRMTGNGEAVAIAVMEHKLSIVLDLSNLRKNRQYAFLTGFLETLYRKNRSPVHVFIDEADAYAPQSRLDQTTNLVGAMQDLVRRGRAKGIGVTLISQRIAAIAKDVLTQIEVLVAFRTVGRQDLDAIKDWVRANADLDDLAQLVKDLPTLPVGTGWLWSPGWLHVLKRCAFRKRRTFDSSSTPTVGSKAAKPVAMGAVPPIAIDKLRVAIEPPIKPSRVHPVQPKADVRIERVEVPVSIRAELDELAAVKAEIVQATAGLGELLNLSREIAGRIDAKLPQNRPAPAAQGSVAQRTERAPTKREVAGSSPARSVSSAGVTAPQQRILDALAWFESAGIVSVAKSNVAVFADASPKSSGYTNNLGSLRTAGLIAYPSGGMVALTDDGRQLTSVSTPASLSELHEAWRAKLSNPQWRIVELLIGIYPEDFPKDELAKLAGVSPKSSGYTNNLGSLRSLGLIDYPERGTAAATELLFPAGLAEASR